MVEQEAVNFEVVGSSPTRGATKFYLVNQYIIMEPKINGLEKPFEEIRPAFPQYGLSKKVTVEMDKEIFVLYFEIEHIDYEIKGQGGDTPLNNSIKQTINELKIGDIKTGDVFEYTGSHFQKRL